jgi:capsular exopolysaccharide synthesis family protein
MGLDRPMRTIQITSSNASEGKTTTLTNLGVVLARAGQRVILVCCDLRRPRLNTFFGLPNTVGFTSVLLGDTPLSAAMQQVPGEQRLLLLSSGPLPPNPSELLSSKRTTELLAALQANCDVVLIDSPPVLPVTDAAVLAGRVDATLLVATARTTTLRELTRAAEILRQVDAPLIGTVLNGITDEEGYGYSYSYEYYRRNEPDPRETARPARPA